MAANSDPATAGDARWASALQRAEALHRLHWTLVARRRGNSFGASANAALHSVLRPLICLLRAWHPMRTYGPAVARAAGIPLWRQFLQLWWVMLRYRFTFDAYYRYRLYRLDAMREALFFVPLNMNIALRGHLYAHLDADPARLEDKRIFYRVCATHGLPVPVTVAEFTHGVSRMRSEDAMLPRRDLFSKPADAFQGEDVARWIRQDDGEHYRGENGQMLTAAELLAHLAECSRRRPYVLQERLANHPVIAALGPNALCTARIVTVRKADGPPEHLGSFFRMPAAGTTSPADNFAAGGFASLVDPVTGVLHDTVRKDLREAAVDCLEYPGSRQRFDSIRLPYWKAALALCLQAHQVFREFPSVGWDVAITPDGPVLVEGNHDWDVVASQQPGCRALGRTPFVDSYFSFLHSQPRLAPHGGEGG